MKTTIEIPDSLFRRAKAHAAERGQTLKEFVADALKARLAARPGSVRDADPEWMSGFGKLSHLRKESAQIRTRIDEAFEQIEAEDRS